MKNNRRILILDASTPSILPSVPTHEHPVGFTKSTAPRKASKLRPSSLKPVKLIAATSALLMVGSAVASTISVDFHGVTQTTSLTAADIAGVVPATTWNAALGNNNFAGIPVDAPSLVGAATVGWTSTGSANTVPNSLATPDHQMMEGYLTGSTNADGTISPASVRVTGLNLSGLGWSSYDLYVYSDTSKNGPSVLIDLFTPSLTSYNHTELITGTYAPPTFSYVDSQISPAGNYVVFTGLTATNFNFQATPLSPINEAAINGFQLVGISVPEPSTGLLALLSISALVLRRCR